MFASLINQISDTIQPLANEWITIIQLLGNIALGTLAYRRKKQVIALRRKNANAQEKTAEEISRASDKEEIRVFIKEVLRPLQEDLTETWKQARLIDENIVGFDQLEYGPFNELREYNFDPSEYAEELKNLHDVHGHDSDLNIAKKIQDLDQACQDYQQNRKHLYESLAKYIRENSKQLAQEYDPSMYDTQSWARSPVSSEKIENELEKSAESFVEDMFYCKNPEISTRYEFQADVLFPRLKREFKYDFQKLEENQNDICSIFDDLLSTSIHSWPNEGSIANLETKLIEDYGITMVEYPD